MMYMVEWNDIYFMYLVFFCIIYVYFIVNVFNIKYVDILIKIFELNIIIGSKIF